MNERQKRLIEVYDHLRQHFAIHTKTGFAESVNYGRTSMSSALNGDTAYLTDNLFQSICDAYPGVFNLDYLLTGEGQLLTLEEEVKSERALQPTTPSPAPQPVIPDYVQRLCDEAARIATRSEILERSLSNAVAESRDLKERLQSSLTESNTLRDQLQVSLSENRTLRQQLSEAVTSIGTMTAQVQQLVSLYQSAQSPRRVPVVQMASESHDYTSAPPLHTYDDGSTSDVNKSTGNDPPPLK